MNIKKCEIIQEENSDCGIACLGSIIKYYNGYIPLEKLRYETDTNQSGTSAFNLLNCAKRTGFNAYGKKVSVEELVNQKLPLIAHLKLNNGFFHFVVIYEIRNNYLLIMDPSIGLKKISYKDFNNIFTGIILLFNPINKLPIYKKNNFINIKLKEHIKNNFIKYFLIILLTILSLLLLILENFEIKILNYNLNYIYLLIFLVVFSEIIIYLKNVLLLNVNIKFNYNIISCFVVHIFKLPLNYLKLKQKGEISTRFNELDNISNNLLNIIFDILFNIFISSFILLILIKVNVIIFIILFILSLLFLIINYYIYKKLVNIIKYSINLEENYNSNIIDYINNFTTIKHISVYDYFINNININLKNKNNISNSISKKIMLINMTNSIIFSLLMLFVVFIIIKNNLNIVNGVFIINIVNYYIDVIKKITEYYPSIILFKNIIRKNNDFLSIKIDKLNTMKNNSYHVRLINLSYNINGNNIINKLNYVINYSDKLFIKGPSGIGKSTLLKIINNEIKNYEGRVLLNGKDIRKYDLTNIVSYTSQDENLFNDTILNNLKLGEEIDEKYFNDIINICRLYDINIIKEYGMDYMLVNNNSISGGERNRIILARSLIHSKNIIILDEVLKEVDYDLEYGIVKDIIKYFDNKLIIYVSHKNVENLFDRVLTFRKE